MNPRTVVVAVLGFGIAMGVGLRFHGQGFDLQTEGLWLLGARTLRLGQDLHASLALDDAGLPSRLLSAWMGVAGESIAALASLRAVLFALATAAATGLLTRARGPWAGAAMLLALLTAMALPWAAAVAWIFAVVVVALGKRTLAAGMVAGIGLALVLLFDLRYGIVLLAFLGFARGATGLPARATATAAVATLAVVAIASGAQGGSALSQTFVAPLVDLARHVDPSRVVTTWWSAPWLGLPFAGLRDTGAIVDAAWPAQGTMRALALRALGVGALVLFVVGASRVRDVRPRARLATGLFAAAVVLLVLRGDVPSLREVAPLLVAGLFVGARTLRPSLGFVGVALVCLPLAAEPVWLALHRDRAPMQVWADARGGVALASGRIERLEGMRQALDPRPGEPMLVWPELPGVYWVMGTEPVAPYLDVPVSNEADTELATALRRDPPRHVLFGFSRALLGHELIRAVPSTWDLLRTNYRLRGRVLAGYEDLRVLTPVADGDGELGTMLPMVELTVANDRTPALREDFPVGQGFRTAHRDMVGFAFRARTSARDVPLRLRVQVWERLVDAYDTLLDSDMIDVIVRFDRHLIFVDFPVEDSANRDLAIVFTVMDTPSAEVRLDWRTDEGGRGSEDLYPAGDALLGLTPVDADLYFLVY